jgi:thiol-disulfide isomerase/thioredoxin
MAKQNRRSTRQKTNYVPLAILAVLVIAGVGLIFVAATRDSADSVSGADEDATSGSGSQVVQPRQGDFTLPGLDREIALADFRGSYVLLNFWATWCPPCKAEMPDLYAYHQEHQDANFTVLAVNVMEDAAPVEDFIARNGFSFPVALDSAGTVFEQYAGSSLPSSFLIGPDGALVKAWPPGMIDRATLDRDVTPLLEG